MPTEDQGRKAILDRIRRGEISADQAFELLTSKGVSAPESEPVDAAADAERLRESLERKLSRIVAGEAQIPVAQVTAEKPFERLGFDSVMALNVVRVLQAGFGELQPTLLFEHQTVASLAGFLLERYPDQIHEFLGISKSSSAVSPVPAAPASAPRSAPAAPRRKARRQPVRPRVRPATDEPVAIIGLSGRFPAAENLDVFWQNLSQGRDCITEVPAHRWNHGRYFDPKPGRDGKSYSKWGGFLQDPEHFDAAFFHISPREAERMDPQERLFLEEVWHALEDAALARGELAGQRIGVYVGVMYSQYQLYQAEEALKGNHLSLGSSYAAIANRVSYLFDFRGPSMALDTMCSSSLTAIHLACDAIRGGVIETAVAGGVNLNIHPAKYLDLSRDRFASTDGRCRAFGEGGDGYVPGEGVGAVVLKSLARAEEDGDLIRAVIRGSALNHGGKTNGFSVPSPSAQGRLIREAFDNAGVDPREVGYIETHGTGTSLGDPIEITGLTSAFEDLDPADSSCAIGSVKSNVGHLEAAAGIAGLSKVVLQMREGKLVPSIHSDPPNPHIDFSAVPFRVQRQLGDWEPSIDAEGRELPRIAGISSFGAGGSNAHLVVEEYMPEAATTSTAAPGPHLILLSAATEERLQAHAGSLVAWLRRQDLANGEPDLLQRIAYTLQTGREPLEERLALWVETLGELLEALDEFARQEASRGDSGAWLRGRVDADGEDLKALLRGRAGDAFVRDLVASRDLERLARLWLRGLGINWKTLHAAPPQKLALPGYPFEKVRHWAPPADGESPSGTYASASLHPLVGRNVSTLHEQRFTTRLDGSESFLRDHVVGDECWVPASALLEMVRAAAVLAGIEERFALVDNVWERPVRLDPAAARDLSVTLDPTDSDVEYVLWSSPAGDDREIHARGRVVALDPDAAVDSSPRLDLDLLQQRCGERILAAAEAYDLFAARGLAYGAGYRVLERVHCGDGEALGRLRLPVGSADEAFVLHPALLDGAFHTLVAFAGSGSESEVPFRLEAIEIEGALPETAWVHASLRADGSTGNRTFDLAIADDHGQVLARLSGLGVQKVRPAVMSAATSPRATGTLALRPVLRPAAAAGSSTALEGSLLVFEGEEGAAAALAARSGAGHWISVRPGDGWNEPADGVIEIDPSEPSHYSRLLRRFSLQEPPLIVHAWTGRIREGDGRQAVEEALNRGFFSQLFLARAILERGIKAPVRVISVHGEGAGEERSVAQALYGMHRTIAQESPALRFSSLALETENGRIAWNDSIAEKILAEVETAPGEVVHWRQGQRWQQELELLPDGLLEAGGTDDVGLRQGGVYLLTGGLGGLGRIFATHLAERFGAHMVLCGRSELDADGEAFLGRLGQLGGEAIYVRADCALEEDAERLVIAAKSTYGRLDGVVHLAGTLRDGFVLRKKRSSAEAVLGPKVWGATSLDAATRDEDLDFFVLASSLTAHMGTVGQADYAFANGYVDQFAAWREEARQQGLRSGKTIAIAWPLWEAGGMGVDEAARALIEERFGWIPLPAAAGLQIFEAALKTRDTQWSVVHGHRARILQTLGRIAGDTEAAAVPTPASKAPAIARPAEAGTGSGEAALREHLRELVAAELKLPLDSLDAGERFERLGIESVMVMNLTQSLEEIFGELPKTLFFEFESVDAVTRYLVDTYPEPVSTHFAPAPTPRQETVPAAAAPTPVPSAAPAATRPAGRFLRSVAPRATDGPRQEISSAAAEPIAIVGLSGRYPMAETVDQLWQNLRSGRDCITEIPPERWDHHRYFHPEPGDGGTSYSKWGGFLSHVDRFDPLFFNISHREARALDPQERLFLQTAWHTIEDAGYTPGQIAGEVGVFVGVMYNQYQLYGAEPELQAQGFVPSSLASSVANRVSFALDLQGPSIALDTMCSSSLTAMHMACASIRNGDCQAALAGGVNLTLHPNKYLQLSQGRFASTDGRCRTFGEGGDGYVPGEGVGAVLLKPLSSALASGDQIYAVIRGSAVNHGGRTNGYSVPSPVAQGAVVRRALERAGVDPAEISYVEAHGTGTSLGDPIEISGLERVFQSSRSGVEGQSCPIGSIKSNIGHLESAAGVAGVTKVLLQMKHRELVPSLHSEVLNPNISFADSPFAVQQSLAAWAPREADGQELPRLATVSSFGAGGSNAHLVLEEHRQAPPAPLPAQISGPRDELIVLSARTEAQLRSVAGALADVLDRGAGESADAGIAESLLPGLAAVAASAIGVGADDIDPDDELEALGVDPLGRSALAERIQEEIGVDFGPRHLDGCRTLREVAEIGAAKAPAVASEADDDLRHIAHTLRVGREALAERLALVGNDRRDLASRLRSFATESPATGSILRGRAAAATAEAPVEPAGRGAAELQDLAVRWVAGQLVDWAPLGIGARRVSLPTYPFAEERFWVPDHQSVLASSGQPAAAATAPAPSPAAEPYESPAHAAAANGRPQPVAEPAPAPAGLEAEPSRMVAPLAADGPAPVAAAPGGGAERKIRNVVVRAMSEVLEIPETEFDFDLPHSDFGVDSVLAVEIVDRINDALAADLKPTDFFNYSTIRKLVEYLVEEVGGDLNEGPTVEAPVAPAATPAPVAPSPDSDVGSPMSGSGDDLTELMVRLRNGEISAAEVDRLLGT